MFYNLQVTKTADGAPAVAAYSFDTIEAAKANHHYFMSSCYGNTELTYFLGEIVDERGACVACESWKKSEPQPEPEPEEVEEEA